MAAQLISIEGLQSYSLRDLPLPTQGPTTLYTPSQKTPYKNPLTVPFAEHTIIIHDTASHYHYSKLQHSASSDT
jgi:hypothetical protein